MKITYRELEKKIEAVMLQVSKLASDVRSMNPNSPDHAYYQINQALAKLDEARTLLALK